MFLIRLVIYINQPVGERTFFIFFIIDEKYDSSGEGVMLFGSNSPTSIGNSMQWLSFDVSLFLIESRFDDFSVVYNVRETFLSVLLFIY